MTTALIGLVGALFGMLISVWSIRYTEQYRKNNELSEQIRNLKAEIERNYGICLETVGNSSLMSPVKMNAWDTLKNSTSIKNLTEQAYKDLLLAFLSAEAINHKVISYIREREDIRYTNPSGSALAGLQSVEKQLRSSFDLLAGLMLKAKKAADSLA